MLDVGYSGLCDVAEHFEEFGRALELVAVLVEADLDLLCVLGLLAEQVALFGLGLEVLVQVDSAGGECFLHEVDWLLR